MTKCEKREEKKGPTPFSAKKQRKGKQTERCLETERDNEWKNS